jgi:putative redox protein
MDSVHAVIGNTPYRTEINIGSKVIWADESTENGGGDTGPSPTQLLAAALASCTAITLRMYSARKGISITSIVADVSIEKENTETFFRRTLRIIGDYNEEQRARLLQIANACPVSKMLTANTKIITEII